ncbi:MAG TPA: hypothetical protein VFJ87_04900 [Rhodanobacteraceae bacterium]|nr:hypothetical protein [Rhodanobacteraceae bacterium]
MAMPNYWKVEVRKGKGFIDAKHVLAQIEQLWRAGQLDDAIAHNSALKACVEALIRGGTAKRNARGHIVLELGPNDTLAAKVGRRAA